MALSVWRREQEVRQTAGVATAGTAVYTIPTNDAAHADKLMRVKATIFLTGAAAAHLNDEAALVAECVAVNKNGTVTFSAAIATSSNPINSNTVGFALTSRPETQSAGVNTSTAVFTIAANVLTLTITNSAAAGGVTADISCMFDIDYVGST